MDSSKEQQELPASTSKSTEQTSKIFNISAIIEAHQPSDAKCVAEMLDGTLVTGGRDGLMKLWKKHDGIFENSQTIAQKDCLSINSVAVADGLDKGFLVFVGRKDGSIAIFSSTNTFNEPIKVLQGHKSNVCALHYDQKTGFLMSGSWDHNALVWPVSDLLSGAGDQVGIGLLSGHVCSVWAVAVVPTQPKPNFLTASADKTIMLWGADYERLGTFLGHNDVVRAVIVLSEKHFLSASNDSSVRLWDLASGSNLRTFYTDHQEFLYTMCLLDSFPSSGSRLVIVCGEGGSIDIFALTGQAGLTHLQSLKMPVHSVWSVTPLANGDFAVAASSGFVLVFTTDSSRTASADIQEFFFSSQYEALEMRDQEVQRAKDPTPVGAFGNGLNGATNMDTEDDTQWRRIGPRNEVSSAQGPNLGYQDPFTGTNRYMPGTRNGTAVAQPNVKRSPIVPLPENYCTFGLDGVSKKVFDRLREMNLTQPKALKMSEDEFCSTEVILTESDFCINECQIVALEKAILWSPETIVPALDLFRIALLHPQLNEIFCSLEPVLGNPPKGASTIRRLMDLLTLPESTDPVCILVCRSMANAAAHEFGRAMLMTEASALWNIVSAQMNSLKTALQVASSSTLLNLSRILLEMSELDAVVELGPREDAVHAIIASLCSVDSFGAHSPLALVRLLQTLIVLLGPSAVANCLSIGELQSLANATCRIKDAVSDDDVKALVRELSDKIGAI
uniref:PUL domain-containing protein n=1 Tax=Globodera pallida TaxID=36090 RepID=A0A183CH72_GLOPA